jgi:transposase
MIERAQIILDCLTGKEVKEIARCRHTRPNTVIKWRQRFSQGGLAGLRDAPRTGARPVYGADFRQRVLALLEQPPPAGKPAWDGPALAGALQVSPHAVWRILRQEGIALRRKRSWCVSLGQEFAAKAVDIVGLYLNPPEKALVISVEEKPDLQTWARKTGYVQTDLNRIVRASKSMYRRHGTLDLFATLRIVAREAKTSITQLKKRGDFLQFMERVAAESSPDQQLHVILDNDGAPEKRGLWLARHPHVHFHVIPASDTWFYHVGIWLDILFRNDLNGLGREGAAELCQAMEEFVAAYARHAESFAWWNPKLKGPRVENTIVNLCK